MSTSLQVHKNIPKETASRNEWGQKGRPKVILDTATVFRLRNEEKLGWRLAAERYRESIGRYGSRDTAKRRYNEAKKQQVILAAKVIPISSSISKKPVFAIKCASPILNTIKVGYLILVMKDRPLLNPNFTIARRIYMIERFLTEATLPLKIRH